MLEYFSFISKLPLKRCWKIEKLIFLITKSNSKKSFPMIFFLSSTNKIYGDLTALWKYHEHPQNVINARNVLMKNFWDRMLRARNENKKKVDKKSWWRRRGFYTTKNFAIGKTRASIFYNINIGKIIFELVYNNKALRKFNRAFFEEGKHKTAFNKFSTFSAQKVFEWTLFAKLLICAFKLFFHPIKTPTRKFYF